MHTMVTSASDYLLLAHVASTWFMVGLIWFVQVVHYPLFRRVGTAGFADYAAAHQTLTTKVVALPMLAEATTAIALAWTTNEVVDRALAWVGVASVGLIWLTTGLLLVPRHRQLLGGFNAKVQQGLVLVNWARTIMWSIRGGLVLGML